MAQDPLLAEAPSEDDLAMARTLLQQRSAEEIAAALVRVYRSRLPAPEEISDPGQQPSARRPRTEFDPGARERGTARPEGAGRDRSSGSHGAGASWFRINIGRRNNADPRWILPMLCRRGGITKGDVGAIRIFDRETKFEVHDGAVGKFAEAIRNGQNMDPRIEPAAEPAQRHQPRHEERPGSTPHRSEEHPSRPHRRRSEAAG